MRSFISRHPFVFVAIAQIIISVTATIAYQRMCELSHLEYDHLSEIVEDCPEVANTDVYKKAFKDDWISEREFSLIVNEINFIKRKKKIKKLKEKSNDR